jgi:hypothetical protein
MRCARLVVAALVAAGSAGCASVTARAAEPCRPGSERHRDGTRTVTQCRDGRVVLRRQLAMLPLDGGVVEKPLSDVRPAAGGVSVETLYTYGSTGAVPGAARVVNDSCSNSEFHRNPSLAVVPWPARGYTYFANLSRMPHGDRDRRQITKGKHTWDITRNGCGFGDATSFKTRYGGRTSATLHSARDRLNVVDFGSLSQFTRDRAVIALSRLWFQNRHLVEADTRFEQPPSIPVGTFRWAVSGRAEARKWDLWSMAAHESGHALGLAHATTSAGNWLTMSPIESLNSTRWQTLGRGDTLGLRALYP